MDAVPDGEVFETRRSVERRFVGSAARCGGSTSITGDIGGHFQSRRLHPLFVFNQFGDLERCALRPGNVHSADGWEDVLKPMLARYSAEARPSITHRRFRADAALLSYGLT